MLAIPSLAIGALTVGPLLFGAYFGESLRVLEQHAAMAQLRNEYHGVGPFIAHGLQSAPFLLAVAGIATAWLAYIRYPALPDRIRERARLLYTVLARKYFADEFNEVVFAGGARALGRLLWRLGDVALIDGLAVNGTARVVGWVATVLRHMQSGYVYHYAFAMILGLFLLITFFLHG